MTSGCIFIFFHISGIACLMAGSFEVVVTERYMSDLWQGVTYLYTYKILHKTQASTSSIYSFHISTICRHESLVIVAIWIKYISVNQRWLWKKAGSLSFQLLSEVCKQIARWKHLKAVGVLSKIQSQAENTFFVKFLQYWNGYTGVCCLFFSVSLLVFPSAVSCHWFPI